MAITALNSAATGLRALSTKIDVTANNLANAETTAFKRSRVNFEDLMYLMQKQPGTTNSNGDPSPAGIFVGLGVRISNTQLDTEQGSMESTSRKLDVGIQGAGFFPVRILSTVGDGVGYTRNVNFFLNSEGDLILNINDGYQLIPPINIPPDVPEDNISIGTDGRVEYIRPGTNTKSLAGQLQLANFPNPQGLYQLGGSVYLKTDASGEALTGNPGENGTGTCLSGFLEGSNVDPVKELVSLIKTQRAFELNSQSIQTADQALQTIGNLRRG